MGARGRLGLGAGLLLVGMLLPMALVLVDLGREVPELSKVVAFLVAAVAILFGLAVIFREAMRPRG